MERGSGDQKLMVGACSGARGKARRMVWGEARRGMVGAPFYRGRGGGGGGGGGREERAATIIGTPAMVPLPE
jgi:hypothetical protein